MILHTESEADAIANVSGYLVRRELIDGLCASNEDVDDGARDKRKSKKRRGECLREHSERMLRVVWRMDMARRGEDW